MSRALLAIAAAGALAACASGRSSDPCAGAAGTCVAFHSGATEAEIQAAVALAAPGTTFGFGAGTYRFANSIAVTASGVTIQGVGGSETVLDFEGQAAGGEGISATGDDFTLRNIGIRDTAGDGVKVEGSTNVKIQGVRVWWTAADPHGNGGYGIYPVASANVLVEGSFASGATDTGIYVGQSQNVVVRDNEATGNVAGIEIENCWGADVHGNSVHGNTGGILVFDLPGLPQQGGHAVRVFQNAVDRNNTPSFAPAGNIVGSVPAGTGIAVMANHDVEIRDNAVTGNQTAAVAVISFVLLGRPYPAGYVPYPSRVMIADNAFSGNGSSPDVTSDLGALLAAVKSILGTPIPDALWDGIADPAKAGTNPQQICITPGTSFLNLNVPGSGVPPSTSSAGFVCTLPLLPPVVLP
ncbi:MAG TPA: parallel beta-helix domain-containing protein [Anaeromyxobacteraceae bacterium]|jgi:parallel beta-helix repeat protein